MNTRIKTPFFFLFGMLSGTAIAVADDAPFFSCDFENEAVGAYTEAKVLAVWQVGTPMKWATVADRCNIVETEDSGKVLSVRCPANVFGANDSGANWKMKLGEKLKSATLAYRVKFPDDADFVKGGKLPGLAGGNAATSQDNTSGGFSARLTWRRNSGEVDAAHGYLCQALFHPYPASSSGEDRRWWASPPIDDDGANGGYISGAWDAHKNAIRYFKPGTWHSVRTFVEVNDIDQTNGIVRAWLDGVLVLDATNLVLRTADTIGIDTLYFSTFYGGDKAEYAPATDQTILFDDFRIWRGEQVPDAPEPPPYAVSHTFPVGAAPDVLHVDFENATPGFFYAKHSNLMNEWQGLGGHITASSSTRTNHCEIVATEDEGQALAILYPAGEIGGKSGTEWKFSFYDKPDAATVEYRIKFPENADFGKGGKLSGLCGGTAPTGGNAPTGADGFSARIMWRSGSAGADKAHGYMCQYLYNVNQISQYGDDLWWASPPIREPGAVGGYTSNWSAHKDAMRYFEPGVWHRVRTYVKVNDVGQNNAVVRAWLDDRLVLDATNLTLRTVDTFGVDVFYFSTFYGGDTADWAPATDQTFLFDDFKIWRGEKPARNMVDVALAIPAGASAVERVVCRFGDDDNIAAGCLPEAVAWQSPDDNVTFTHRAGGLRIGHPYVYAFEIFDDADTLVFAQTNRVTIAGTCVWTGDGADADWHTPENWDFGVPGEFADAIISNAAHVAVSAPVKLANLELRNASVLVFNLAPDSATTPVIDASGAIAADERCGIFVAAEHFSGDVVLMHARDGVPELTDENFNVRVAKNSAYRITRTSNEIAFRAWRTSSLIVVR